MVNKISGTLATSIFLLTGSIAFAQNEMEALTLSQSQAGSTALSMSMGGVGGSMGGDMNAISINPAGIGVYRKQEFSITPVIKLGTAQSSVGNFNTNKNYGGFYLGNIGMVITHTPRRGQWKNINFGFSVNTTNQFRSKTSARYENYENSVSDIFAEDAYQNGVEQNMLPPYGFLGYQGYLIDDDYYSIIPVSQGLRQQKNYLNTGNSREYAFTLGGNYNEKLLLGLSANIVSYRYDRSMVFSEDDMSSNPNNNFSYLDLEEEVFTDGIGFNAKFGAIFIPVKNFRIGAAFHTPTWSAMNDMSDYKLTTHTENYKAGLGGTDIDPVSIAQPDSRYTYNYSLRTPYKFVLSATTFGRMGMLSADYEFNDYSVMRYSMKNDETYERFMNEKIASTFKATHTFRVGGELVLRNLYLRAGGSYQTSPYANTTLTPDGERISLTAGLGFRFAGLMLDFGYRHAIQNAYQNLYNMNANGITNPIISSQFNTNYVAMTLGFKL